MRKRKFDYVIPYMAYTTCCICLWSTGECASCITLLHFISIRFKCSMKKYLFYRTEFLFRKINTIYHLLGWVYSQALPTHCLGRFWRAHAKATAGPCWQFKSVDVASNLCHPGWFPNTKVATQPPFYFTLWDACFYFVGKDMKGGEDRQLETQELLAA